MDAESRSFFPRRLGAEFGKFGVVGLVNYAVDLALFNLLLFTVFEHAPWMAKVCSTTVAGVSSYFMNRHWTWRHRERNGTARELSIFLVISALALGLTELCLLVSHAGLGLTTKLDDNISANVVGTVLAMVARFWALRTFVFRQLASPTAPAPDPTRDGSEQVDATARTRRPAQPTASLVEGGST